MERIEDKYFDIVRLSLFFSLRLHFFRVPRSMAVVVFGSTQDTLHSNFIGLSKKNLAKVSISNDL